MNVTFYNFSKRRNSTKQPTGTGTVKDCKLKDNCSIHNPVMICTGSTVTYNYVHISTWNRYYFVTDVVFLVNNLVEYHLTEDVLGSNKTAIGNSTAYIAFASTGFDYYMPDARLALGSQKTAGHLDGPNWFNDSHYLLAVFNDSNGATDVSGMATVYYLTESELRAFKAWMSTTTIMDALQAYFHGDPMQAIFSLKWIPYTIPGAHLATTNGISIGNQSWNHTGVSYVKDYAFIELSYGFSHSMVYTSDFRGFSPYTTGILYLPGVGTMPINTGDFVLSENITVKCHIEAVTGSVMYTIEKGSTGIIVASASTNVAADAPLGRSTINAAGVMSGLAGAIGGTAGALVGFATQDLIGAAGGAAQAISSGINIVLAASQHTASIAGGIGSRCSSSIPHATYSEYYIDTENPDDTNYISHRGRPVNKVDSVGDYSGYVQCLNASVALNASEQEIREVNDFLNSGIYYE